jgi:hypothetical protein
MDKIRVNTFLLTNRECFLDEDIPLIRQIMESADDSKWDALSTLDLKNPQTALMLSIFGGPIGVDRLYIGDYLLGVFKTITCGGLLIWAFVDQFLIRRATKENNRQMFMEILTI